MNHQQQAVEGRDEEQNMKHKVFGVIPRE